MLIILGTILCYSLLYGATKENDASVKEKAKASSTIGITVSTLLLLLYILFCSIQILYLFAGGLFSLPDELTYAEYARRGFFELLAVTCFNIILILICVTVFEESRLLKTLLTGITASTYIMIASATYRMLLYISAYHLTFLRLFVLLFLLIDALLLLGVIISLYRKDFPLFGYSVVVISVCYLAFSLSKPDYHIAKYFIAHTEEITSEDIYFLTKDLSYDAAPVVLSFLKGQYKYNTYDYVDTYYNEADTRGDRMDIRDYNFSYQKAYNLIR
jgi:hypothetical protein